MLSDTNNTTRGWIDRNLLRQLAPVFAPHKFKRHKSAYSWGWTWSFRRVTKDVTQWIKFVTTPRDEHFLWSLLIQYRSEAAEAIFDRFVPGLPERSSSATCAFNLESLVRWNSRQEIALNTQALQESVTEIIPALNEVVLPFLDASRDLVGINDLMNGTHKDLCIRGSQVNFAMRSIIVARLACVPNWGRLVARLRRQLMARNLSLETYDRLAECLGQEKMTQLDSASDK
jgi:hypothetical protein